ncbi:rhomboid family intramembrane serine protease [Aureibaculum sp. A20]|uniref:Rhomboid family intramembrane serine protease n=1 Tax=Aureibaculum flavum TaxID=2795986 RepID=A0ABS0WNW6_9FLAO|nr:rhomboid family intramembrane serine protease [Aureibaculum flavum]MBJ2173675.1 rhomboid family intramembrane serine protease [Aureibaculum flavum]
MNKYKIKLQEIYLPFLIVSIGTILIYNIFRWTFDIKLGILPLKEDVLNFWIPFALPWIPIFIWLRRRLRILNIKGKSGNGYFIYQFAMVGAIIAPLMVSQNYLEKASYDLIEIDSIDYTSDFENEKYFQINSFNVTKAKIFSYVTARTSGRNNENLNYYIYFSCPFENSNDVSYGVQYKKNLSNRISERQKDTQYRNFIKKSEIEFQSYNFNKAKYFEKLNHSDTRDGFIEAMKHTYPNVNEKEQVILIPKFDNFNQRLGNTFPWIFGSFGIASLIILIMILIPNIDQNELNNLKKDKPLQEDDLRDILEFLDPRGPYKATAILILLNILVFIIMTFSGINIASPTAKELLEFGGNRRFEVLNDEYWRLLTSVFIHGGLMHLIMNLFGLGLAGSLLENVLGHTRLFISFIVCGILASLASIYWYENTISVGASGAIFGLFGLILAFTIFKIYPNYMRGITWILLGLYAGLNLLVGFFMSGIDNAAHIGGLISGFVIGGLLILTSKEKLINNINKH